MFRLDRKVPVHGGEAVLRGGKVLGVTTSADFGHTIGAPIVYAYVPASEAGHDRYEVEVFGEAVPARRTFEPLYDPQGARFRS